MRSYGMQVVAQRISSEIRKKPLSFGVLVVSLASHGLIALAQLFHIDNIKVTFLTEFLTCLCISAVLEIAVFFIQRLDIYRALHLLRCAVLLIIFQLPDEKTTYIPILLSAAFLIESALYDDTRFAVGFNIALIVFFSITCMARLRFGSQEGTAIYLATYVIISGLTASIGILMVRYREALAESDKHIKRLNTTVLNLSDANKAFQIYADNIESESAQKERNRITRELHDTVGYAMTNVIIMMNAARVVLNEDLAGLDMLLEKVGDQTEQALNETRQTLHRLRNMEMHKPKGLQAISQLTRGFEGATGIEIRLNTGNLPWSLGMKIDSALFRFVQEGLTNAFRHGKATRIQINLWRTPDELRASIRDNGQGLDSEEPVEDGIGLSGMKERFSSFGGKIVAHNVADGFELSATIPYRAGEMVEKN